MSWKWASSVCQRHLAMHLGEYKGSGATLSHYWTIGSLSRQKCLRRLRPYALKKIVTGASTFLSLASWNIKWLWDCCDPQSNCGPPFYTEILSTTSSTCQNNECLRCVNDFRPSIWEYPGSMRLLWSLIELSAAFPANNAYDKIVTMSQNERQQRVNNFWSWILDNLMAKEHR